MCPPCGNDAAGIAAQDVNDNDGNALQETDGENAVFALTIFASLEYWAIEYALSIAKIDVVFCEVQQPLAFIPLEEHVPVPRWSRRLRMYNMYTPADGLSSVLGSPVQQRGQDPAFVLRGWGTRLKKFPRRGSSGRFADKSPQGRNAHI
jgi:hypothetical protein